MTVPSAENLEKGFKNVTSLAQKQPMVLVMLGMLMFIITTPQMTEVLDPLLSDLGLPIRDDMGAISMPGAMYQAALFVGLLFLVSYLTK